MQKILQKIFSITNENTHKLITVLGIKIKFSKKNDTIQEGYSITGSGNKIIIIDENGSETELSNKEKINGLDIKIEGENNIIKLEMPIKFSDTFIDINKNNNSFIFIKKNCDLTIRHLRCLNSENQRLIIGENTVMYGATIVLDDASCCSIGNNCLCAGGFNIWAGDGHTILDKNTNEILNLSKTKVSIGNNCWIAIDAFFTKNAQIPDWTVVGAKSVVTKLFSESNCVIAGNPAKIVKKNVIWDGNSPHYLFRQSYNKTNTTQKEVSWN